MKSICCVDSTCIRWSCGCFHSLFGFNLHHYIKLSNFLLILLFIGVSLILSAATKDPSIYLITNTGCEDSSNQPQCVASQLIQRVFFSLALVFFAMIFLSSIRSEKAKMINEGLWLLKVVVVVGLIGFTLLLGPTVFKVVKVVCFSCWLIFSMLQSFVVIDLSYNLTNRMKERIELGAGKSLQILNYLMIVGYYVAAISLNAYGYNNWGIPRGMSITNSVFIGLFLFLAMFGGNKLNTVLNSGIILTYLQLLTFIASRVIQRPTQPLQPSTWIFLTWFLLLLVVFCGMLSRGSGRIKMGASSANQKLQLVTKQTDQQNIGYLNSNKWAIFYSILAVMSLAVSVQINQWNKTEETRLETFVVWKGYLSLVIGYVVYLWSIICVKCYPDRDLSELESYFKEFELS